MTRISYRWRPIPQPLFLRAAASVPLAQEGSSWLNTTAFETRQVTSGSRPVLVAYDHRPDDPPRAPRADDARALRAFLEDARLEDLPADLSDDTVVMQLSPAEACVASAQGTDLVVFDAEGCASYHIAKPQ